jgi:murein L,D-transpeptidase YafK
MKFIKFFTLIIYLFCFNLFINTSSAASTSSKPEDFSKEKDILGRIFNAAVASEPIHFILVEKNLQRLRVYEYKNELKVIAEFTAATGENSGIKEVSGDSKTPEGIYFITRIFRDDKVTIFGDKAFHLDYPNFFDRIKGRNGDGIYIHGTNKKLQPNSTNGCVTLAKNDLDQLEEYLHQMVTPVIIIPEINSIETDTLLLTENKFRLAKSLLLNNEMKPEDVEFKKLYIVSSKGQTVAVSDFIYRPFKRLIMHGTSKAYLHFNPVQGWTTGKRIWQAGPLQIYPESPVKIAARPFVTDETTISEHEVKDSAASVKYLNSPVTHGEILSLEKAQNPLDEISSELKQHELEKVQDKKTALMRINKPEVIEKKMEIQPPAIIFDHQQIQNFVERWRKAWVSQQIEHYIAFYDESFKSGNKNLAEWKEHKKNINKTYSYISVEISDIKIHRTAEGARVSFRQKYLSDRYNTTGDKILYLVHNGSGWKIKGEFYSGI